MVSVSYNRFGAVYTDVIALYPGTQAADYGTASGAPDATAGQTAIEAALDYYSRKAAMALTGDSYSRIIAPQAELITECTTAGQTSFQLGMFPIVAGSVHLFRYGDWPQAMPMPSRGGGTAYGEIDSGDFSVTASTGAITYTGSTAFVKGEAVFATYEVDTANANYSMPSLKDVVLRGAAAELGSRLFTQSTDEWKLVEDYRAQWVEFVAAANVGNWLPDELRFLEWWDEADKSDGFGSMLIARG